jgi:hypothetical protein
MMLVESLLRRQVLKDQKKTIGRSMSCRCRVVVVMQVCILIARQA